MICDYYFPLPLHLKQNQKSTMRKHRSTPDVRTVSYIFLERSFGQACSMGIQTTRKCPHLHLHLPPPLLYSALPTSNFQVSTRPPMQLSDDGTGIIYDEIYLYQQLLPSTTAYTPCVHTTGPSQDLRPLLPPPRSPIILNIKFTL